MEIVYDKNYGADADGNRGTSVSSLKFDYSEDEDYEIAGMIIDKAIADGFQDAVTLEYEEHEFDIKTLDYDKEITEIFREDFLNIRRKGRERLRSSAIEEINNYKYFKLEETPDSSFGIKSFFETNDDESYEATDLREFAFIAEETQDSKDIPYAFALSFRNNKENVEYVKEKIMKQLEKVEDVELQIDNDRARIVISSQSEGLYYKMDEVAEAVMKTDSEHIYIANKGIDIRLKDDDLILELDNKNGMILIDDESVKGSDGKKNLEKLTKIGSIHKAKEYRADDENTNLSSSVQEKMKEINALVQTIGSVNIDEIKTPLPDVKRKPSSRPKR